MLFWLYFLHFNIKCDTKTIISYLLRLTVNLKISVFYYGKRWTFAIKNANMALPLPADGGRYVCGEADKAHGKAGPVSVCVLL